VDATVTGKPLFGLPPSGEAATLVGRGSEWEYWDRGSEPACSWKAAGVGETEWPRGVAELGFGDGDEVTAIEGGPSGNRHRAAYFRRSFVVPDPSRYSLLILRLKRDDGSIVYLNGEEVTRSNMPHGPIAYDTLAESAASSEDVFMTHEIPSVSLRSGTNVVAVEVHQSSATSSDLSFDLELLAVPPARLHFEPAGSSLWLFWADGTLELQESDQVTGPWSTGQSASSPVLVTPGDRRFYRLARPGQ
jgi:hypothetical protein